MQLPPGKLEAPQRTLGVDTNYLVEVYGLRKQRPCGERAGGWRSAAAGGVVGAREQSSGALAVVLRDGSGEQGQAERVAVDGASSG